MRNIVDLVELEALEKGEPPAVGKAVNSFVIDLVVGFALGRFPSDSQMKPGKPGTISQVSLPCQTEGLHILQLIAPLTAGVSLLGELWLRTGPSSVLLHWGCGL